MKFYLSLLLLSATFTFVFGQSIFMSSYLEKQLQCALDKAPCDYYGQQIKRSLPYILNYECKNCDPRKMTNAQLLARYIELRYPTIWAELIQKYGIRNGKVDINGTL